MRTGVLLIGLVLASACGPAERDPAPAASPVAVAPADAEGRLDPTAYRAQIEAVEAGLYSDEVLPDEGWKALSKALLDLHNEIVFRDSSPSARETSGRLFFLSARVDAAVNGRHDEAELVELRGLWSELCAEKFARVDWIRAESSAR